MQTQLKLIVAQLQVLANLEEFTSEDYNLLDALTVQLQKLLEN
jgi:hypothetical protein